MTFMPLTLDLNEYGILSGQLYQPEVHSVGQLEQSAYFFGPRDQSEMLRNGSVTLLD